MGSYSGQGISVAGIYISGVPTVISGNTITNIIAGDSVSSYVYQNLRGGDAWGIYFASSFPSIDVLSSTPSSCILQLQNYGSIILLHTQTSFVTQ